MATPNFDSISVIVSRLAGDPVVSASTAGTFMTAAERNAYVNKALNQFFAQMWRELNFDFKAMVRAFPELGKITSGATTTAAGIYDIAASASYQDYFKLIDSYKTSGNNHIRVMPKELYITALLGTNELYTPSSTNMMVFELADGLHFLPTASFVSAGITLHYIQAPLDPTSGNFITQGGSYDSPFYTHWDAVIADIAANMIKMDRQEK